MIKKVSICFAGEIPGIKTSDIPLNPRREDFPLVNHWDGTIWAGTRNGTIPNLTDLPTLSLFLEDEFGRPIAKNVKKSLLGDITAFWNEMISEGKTLTTFSKANFTTKESFRTLLEGKYPWLRLCEGHWKVNQLWVNYYTQRTSTSKSKPKTLPDGTPVPVIEIDTSDSGSSTGSKRGREDITVLMPSKKHKGEQLDNSPPHPIQLQPKKSKAKVAKVSTVSFLLD